MYLVICNQVTVEVQSLIYHLFKTAYLDAYDYRGLFSIFFFPLPACSLFHILTYSNYVIYDIDNGMRRMGLAPRFSSEDHAELFAALQRCTGCRCGVSLTSDWTGLSIGLIPHPDAFGHIHL